MTFLIIKALHISCVIISYTLFFLRGIWTLNDDAIMQQRWVKIAPHIIDTLLLSSALAYTIAQYPFVDSWLTAKVLALLLYIWLGSIALKYAKNRMLRVFSWLAAQAVFGYIVLVALDHNPLPYIH